MAVSIKEQNDIINDILIDLVTNVTKINDLNPGSVIRTLAESIAQEIYLQYEQLQSIYDGTRVASATADDLDNIGSIVGVTRIPGATASGTITFIRNTIAASNFVIPANSVVSTQPGIANVYEYSTTEAKTFLAQIPTEQQRFYDGIRKYKLSQRIIGDIISLQGTKNSVAKSFVKPTDYSIIKLSEGYIVTDATSIIELDDCDAVTGWNESTDAVAVATEGTDKIEGTNSLKLGKSGATQNYIWYYKTLASPVNIENKKVFFNVKIKDQTTLEKITKMKIIISSDSNPINNYYIKTINVNQLSIGWNEYVLDYLIGGDAVKYAFPNPATINSVKIEFETVDTTTTITSGDILIDYIYSSLAEYYVGDIIQFVSYDRYPDNNTLMTFNWRPLSIDINCIANGIGSDYNAARNAIMYKVSNLPYINSVNNYEPMTNGSDEELDDNYRQRIQNAASSPGKASVAALRNAVLSIPGVASVIIDDLPVRTIEDEAQIFNEHTLQNKLLNEVAFLDDNTTPTNILVTNTFGGTADYVYGTDYILVDNHIKWISGATNPTHGAIYYVDYQVNWLGHVEMLVAGNTFPISTTLSNSITEAIDSTKAAGVSVTWQEPSVVEINISCNVQVNTLLGYNEDTVKEEVQRNIIDWLNNMQINEDILVSEFYKIVMNTEGVTNVEIINWNGVMMPPFSDITIAETEIARPADGGIIVN